MKLPPDLDPRKIRIRTRSEAGRKRVALIHKGLILYEGGPTSLESKRIEILEAVVKQQANRIDIIAAQLGKFEIIPVLDDSNIEPVE